MKKKTSTTAFICLFLYSIVFVSCQKRNQVQIAYADRKVNLVPVDSAKRIAQLFNPTIYYKVNNPNNHSAFRSTLNGNNLIKDYSVINDKEGIPALYVFNYAHDQGFIFVSADYQQQPILAFIEQGTFRKDTVPAGLIMWANKTVNNIESLRLGLHNNSKAANAAWRRIHEVNRSALKTSPVNNGATPPTDPCSDPNYYSVTTDVVGPLASGYLGAIMHIQRELPKQRLQ